MVDFCPSGQGQYYQCGKPQAHHCQNQPGIMLHVPHPWSQGEFCGPKRTLRHPQKLHKANVDTRTSCELLKFGAALLNYWQISVRQRAERAHCVYDKASTSIWPILQATFKCTERELHSDLAVYAPTSGGNSGQSDEFIRWSFPDGHYDWKVNL